MGTNQENGNSLKQIYKIALFLDFWKNAIFVSIYDCQIFGEIRLNSQFDFFNNKYAWVFEIIFVILKYIIHILKVKNYEEAKKGNNHLCCE